MVAPDKWQSQYLSPDLFLIEPFVKSLICPSDVEQEARCPLP